MKASVADRTIRAGALRHRLAASQQPVHVTGMLLRDARIIGTFDLELAMLRCTPAVQECYPKRPVNVDHATVLLLSSTGCWLAGIGDGAIVTAELANSADLAQVCSPPAPARNPSHPPAHAEPVAAGSGVPEVGWPSCAT
jgi:hypothetical protein